jgi:hypothetical protein
MIRELLGVTATVFRLLREQKEALITHQNDREALNE